MNRFLILNLLVHRVATLNGYIHISSKYAPTSRHNNNNKKKLRYMSAALHYVQYLHSCSMPERSKHFILYKQKYSYSPVFLIRVIFTYGSFFCSIYTFFYHQCKRKKMSYNLLFRPHRLHSCNKKFSINFMDERRSLENLIITQPVKKLIVFVTSFTRSHHWSLSSVGWPVHILTSYLINIVTWWSDYRRGWIGNRLYWTLKNVRD
jgi:hypothetical protein